MSNTSPEFQVTVHTSPGPTCGTFSRLWLSLIGSQGETPPIPVNEGQHLLRGSVSFYHLFPVWEPEPVASCWFPSSRPQFDFLLQVCPVRVQANGPLGCVLLVRLRLEARAGFPDLNWHCSRVEVRRVTEDPDVQLFPGDRWLQTADGDVELRSGTRNRTLGF